MAHTLDVEAVRAQLPSTQTAAFLNTGSAGPIPIDCAQAMAEAAQAELIDGRIAPAEFGRLRERIAGLRQELASVVGAQPGEAALTQGTSVGMNIAIGGLEWEPGDEVVTTTQEHEGTLLPLYLLHRRRGVRVTFADVGYGEADRALEAMQVAIKLGVKAVVLSHVLYTTGATLPLREIVEIAHAAGCLVIADGAQAVGAIPVSAPGLGVDAYAFSGQKWLLGPESTGGLFVRGDLLDRFAPSFISYMGVDDNGYQWNDPDSLTLPAGAERYEFALPYRPVVAGLTAALAWVRDEVGRDAAHALIAENTHYCRERARELPGAEVLTPAGQEAGLIALKVPGLDPVSTVERLAAQGVLIRWIPENGGLRVSCGFYNTRTEIDRALELIAAD